MLIEIAGPGKFAVEVVGVSRRQDVLADIVVRHGRMQSHGSMRTSCSKIRTNQRLDRGEFFTAS